jgi:hypothetical protein
MENAKVVTAFIDPDGKSINILEDGSWWFWSQFRNDWVETHPPMKHL